MDGGGGYVIRGVNSRDRKATRGAGKGKERRAGGELVSVQVELVK